MLLSRNYAPSADLAAYVRRHYVFHAPLPDDFVLIDKLMSETAIIRILLQGDWAAETGPDQWSNFGPIPLMGPNGIPWRVRVRGPFLVVGVAIRPGGWASLFAEPARAIADGARPLMALWGDLGERLYRDVAAAPDDHAVVEAIERVLRQRLATYCGPPPSAAMAAFEEIAREDSTIPVARAAQQVGLSVRQFERQCYASFGHSPKVILRRSRFLDMAQAMRGFSEPSAEQLAALRYFDQSHRNREFRHFFQLTPGQFDKVTTPLFTAGLKLRADGLA
ncbi:putative AraC family transcriptional regulator [Sphingobium sp. SYK-6]|uniref:helix-turn-helix domain-containing protein n=1 Tax=Sphingobium sp. (strain NBRC 103272 / SYK-6) TaxID=627192 RepID=UPI00022776B9|nr:AraC family transcriptional regulator [Sphingobium sp. SYK-6]BAK67888.1 putative AraC family transcriptional regulator [Sphingobium sp. SYK-6]